MIMHGKILTECDPVALLMLATLRQARIDAQKGDPFAALWLLSDGVLWADSVVPDGGDWVMGWLCRRYR